jgi:UTP--glucose-1-phosphate uridylyltransferase
VTLSGVVFLVPAVGALSRRYRDEFAAVVAAFAAGALLSCALNLLLFEATHLIATGGFDGEAAVTWRWGAMILAGFLTSTLIDCAVSFVAQDSHPVHALPAAFPDPGPGSPAPTALLPGALPATAPGMDPLAPVMALSASLYAPPCKELASAKDPEAGGGPGAAAAPSLRERARLIGGVVVGDFCHNLCDGVFLGAAFSACGAGAGWSVAAATAVHEVAQELSDYTLLVSPEQGGLRPLAALTLNFASGLSVTVGAIIVLAAHVSDLATGLLLAFGGGVYIHVAAAECMPRVYRLPIAPAVRLLALLAFVLGAAAIALVLLSHEHCAEPLAGPAGAADPHAGHGH